ncbi:hypothetical protein CONPUDRAFT_134150 [Coniophora puteana RWD-64-598 SS2]|uniref:Tethering factor for nuclear proteasome STS1 n=1 Tax=Coniophora puteana (strain RWD-64-598) TaxID=741705 RepID=A0A5M3N6V7_CONPW|nr:uncharacterized protein CONPUDRAFT_134150 [Coniophora puteana RWD-64-598 SS2]EIW86794.1 hypothetical protein CONPUDRAFT_134150 [Coniophora puteana RWD-64-598 SS2]
MANVVHPHINFFPRPVNSHPSLGFGFGLSSDQACRQATATPPVQQLASTFQLPSTNRIQKRRFDAEDDAESSRQSARDVAMDRSPTPERPKRTAPKRARTIQGDGKDDKSSKETVSTSAAADVDLGVLLASLPPSTLLPLLNSLITAQPSLKTTILSLIPRPTLETALQALEQSMKKLRDAYPYSAAPIQNPTVASTSSFGFGSSFSASRSDVTGSSGFGRLVSPQPSILQSHQAQQSTGMRDSYVQSRLRPHIHNFVSIATSYLPYFSLVPSSAHESLASANQIQRKEKASPTEAYAFLAALTSHILCQPPLTQASLAPLLLPRLQQEWKAWVDRVDEYVNREGGMFGSETVKGWEKGLDEYAEAKGPDGWEIFRGMRDHWVLKVGWLVGRTMHQPMEEGL